jgi:hypothetical protein
MINLHIIFLVLVYVPETRISLKLRKLYINHQIIQKFSSAASTEVNLAVAISECFPNLPLVVSK